MAAREEGQAEALVALIIAAIIVCVVSAAVSLYAMERVVRTVEVQRAQDVADNVAAIQARWEASARARRTVRP